MDLRQIHYFTALYEEGSVTRAARRLNIVQPALSMQISRLETEMGQKLFERSSQGMLPTEAGRLAYRLYMPILRDLAEARQRVAAGGLNDVPARFSVGLIASVTNSVLGRTLAAFCDEYPQVHVSTSEGYSATLVEWVQAGLLDFAIVNQSRPRRDLPAIDILDEDLVLLASPSTRVKAGPVLFRELPGLKLVLPSRRHGLRGIIDHAAESEDVCIEPRLEADALPVIAELVGQSDWCTVLPRITLHRSLAAGHLRAHPIVSPRVARRIVCVHNPRRPIQVVGRHFLDRLTAQLREAAAASLEGADRPVARGPAIQAG